MEKKKQRSQSLKHKGYKAIIKETNKTTCLYWQVINHHSPPTVPNKFLSFDAYIDSSELVAWAEMAGRNYCVRDVLPFTSLVAMECVNVGLNTLYKAATLKGMNYLVFIVYAYAIAALLLLPSPFISCRFLSFFLFSASDHSYKKFSKWVFKEIN